MQETLVLVAVIGIVAFLFILFLGRGVREKYKIGVFFSIETFALFVALNLLGFVGAAYEDTYINLANKILSQGRSNFFTQFIQSSAALSEQSTMLLLLLPLGILLFILIMNWSRSNFFMGIIITVGQFISAILWGYLLAIAVFAYNFYFLKPV